jgi:hypothetical protein
VVDHSIPVGPTPEEEAALLTTDRTSEEFYGQPPREEQGDAEPATAASLPPMEDLLKRIPIPARELLEELFRARFVTVKRVPKAALKD